MFTGRFILLLVFIFNLNLMFYECRNRKKVLVVEVDSFGNNEGNSENPNILRTKYEVEFEEGFFSRFVRRVLETLGNRFLRCKLKKYCRIVRQLLDKYDFRGSRMLYDIFKDLAKRSGLQIESEFQSYLKMYEDKTPTQIEFLKAMDEVLYYQRAMKLEMYVDYLQEYGEGKRLKIRKETKAVIKAILHAVRKSSSATRVDIDEKLKKCFSGAEEELVEDMGVEPSLVQTMIAKFIQENRNKALEKRNSTAL